MPRWEMKLTTIFPFFGIFTLFVLFISDASQARVCLSRSSSLNNSSAYPLPLAKLILFQTVAAQSITKHRFLYGCLSPGWLCFQIISVVVQELRQNETLLTGAGASLPRLSRALCNNSKKPSGLTSGPGYSLSPPNRYLMFLCTLESTRASGKTSDLQSAQKRAQSARMPF